MPDIAPPAGGGSRTFDKDGKLLSAEKPTDDHPDGNCARDAQGKPLFGTAFTASFGYDTDPRGPSKPEVTLIDGKSGAPVSAPAALTTANPA